MIFLTDAEDQTRYTAPELLNNGEGDTLEPYEAGFEARVCCQPRHSNPYAHKNNQETEWNMGWDKADQEPEIESPI